MKRRILAVVILCSLLLTGCSLITHINPSVNQEETPEHKEQTTSVTSAPPSSESVDDISLSIAEAFRIKDAPAGRIDRNTACFFKGGTYETVQMTEVLEFDDSGKLAYTTYYDQFLDETFGPFLQCMRYAIANGYSRFCFPSTNGIGGDALLRAKTYIEEAFLFSYSSASVGTFQLEEGNTLYFNLVTIPGMELINLDKREEAYQEALRIVDSIPDSCQTEYDKALYLYEYITRTVNYFDVDNPQSYYDTDYDLIYDALILHNTVCAGYAYALFYLYNLAGIQCILVTGYMVDPETSTTAWHAWNIARIDGAYYLFDSTWDAGMSKRHYLFFGISSDTMQSFYPRSVVNFYQETLPDCESDLPHP